MKKLAAVLIATVFAIALAHAQSTPPAQRAAGSPPPNSNTAQPIQIAQAGGVDSATAAAAGGLSGPTIAAITAAIVISAAIAGNNGNGSSGTTGTTGTTAP